mgnify:CR=1 FL=1
MRSRRKGRKLGRKTAHRLAMLNNLAMSLLEHGRITTTVDRAKEASRLSHKLITIAKSGTLHDRRNASAYIKKASVLKRLFEDIAPILKNRAGGYTRILKLGPRRGDGAEKALLELVEIPKTKAQIEAENKEDDKRTA